MEPGILIALDKQYDDLHVHLEHNLDIRRLAAPWTKTLIPAYTRSLQILQPLIAILRTLRHPAFSLLPIYQSLSAAERRDTRPPA